MLTEFYQVAILHKYSFENLYKSLKKEPIQTVHILVKKNSAKTCSKLFRGFISYVFTRLIRFQSNRHFCKLLAIV